MGGRRGRKIGLTDRQTVINLVDEARINGARQEKACELIGITERTLQRWKEGHDDIREDGRLSAAQIRIPSNRITLEEKQLILEVSNKPEFASLPPSQIVPALADQGEYIASESTFYRVLKAEKQLAHRGKAKAPTHSRPKPLEATGPNQVWSWDITYLTSTVSGIFFFLYMIIDVFSRKIVGWEVYAEQNSEYASIVFSKAYLRERVMNEELVLHSDNGSPMKGATLLATLQRLGVVPSFSRPSVSDDNPYSEALFKTCKYHHTFPDKPFEDIDQARQWVAGFEHWYNEEHRHSGIRFVPPAARHRGEDKDILAKRIAVYEAAREAHPERWAQGIRNWNPIEIVTLNPSKGSPEKRCEMIDS